MRRNRFVQDDCSEPKRNSLSPTACEQTVSEEAIIAAMRTVWETMKIIIEPSAAVPYAAILESKIDIGGKRVGMIVTGGNVDLDALPWNL